MNSRVKKQTLAAPIYPAYCFRASPTYDVWAKLTAADVHLIREEQGFEGQDVFFYLNHPIRFVRIVAPIVAIDDINSTLTLLTLDDGSGATIDVKISRIAPDPTSNLANEHSITDPNNESGELPTTRVPNLTIISRPGTFALLLNSTHTLDIGTIVKAKCTISTFRSVRQLELQRLSIVPDTNAEAAAWTELATFRRQVLLRPWHLSATELRHLADERNAEVKREAEEARKAKERALRKREKQTRWEERRKAYEDKREKRRKKEEIMFNAGALV